MDWLPYTQPRLFIEQHKDTGYLIVGCGSSIEYCPCPSLLTSRSPLLNVFAQLDYSSDGFQRDDNYVRGVRFFPSSSDVVLLYSFSCVAVVSREEMLRGGDVCSERVVEFDHPFHDLALVDDKTLLISFGDRLVWHSIEMRGKSLHIKETNTVSTPKRCLGNLVRACIRVLSPSKVLVYTMHRDSEHFELRRIDFEKGEVVYDHVHDMHQSLFEILPIEKRFDLVDIKPYDMTVLFGQANGQKYVNILIRASMGKPIDRREVLFDFRHSPEPQVCNFLGEEMHIGPALGGCTEFDVSSEPLRESARKPKPPPANDYDETLQSVICCQSFWTRYMAHGPTVFCSSQTRDLLARMIDKPHQKETHILAHLPFETIRSLALSQDKATLFVGCESGRLCFVDVGAWRDGGEPLSRSPLRTHRILNGQQGCDFLHIQEDGHVIALSHKDGQMYDKTCHHSVNSDYSKGTHTKLPVFYLEGLEQFQMTGNRFGCFFFVPHSYYCLLFPNYETLRKQDYYSTDIKLKTSHCASAIYPLGPDILIQDSEFSLVLNIRATPTTSEREIVLGRPGIMVPIKMKKAVRVRRNVGSSYVVVLYENGQLTYHKYEKVTQSMLAESGKEFEPPEDIYISIKNVLSQVTAEGMLCQHSVEWDFADTRIRSYVELWEGANRRALRFHPVKYPDGEDALLLGVHCSDKVSPQLELWDTASRACLYSVALDPSNSAPFHYAVRFTPTHLNIVHQHTEGEVMMSRLIPVCRLRATPPRPLLLGAGDAHSSRGSFAVAGLTNRSLHLHTPHRFFGVPLPVSSPLLVCVASAVLFEEGVGGRTRHALFIYQPSPDGSHPLTCIEMRDDEEKKTLCVEKILHKNLPAEPVALYNNERMGLECLVVLPQQLIVFDVRGDLVTDVSWPGAPLKQARSASSMVDETSILVLDESGRVAKWGDAVGWSELRLGRNCEPTCIDFSAEAGILVGEASGRIRIWDGELLHTGTLDYHTAPVKVARGLDCQCLLVMSIDRVKAEAVLHKWNGKTDKGIRQYSVLARLALGCPLTSTIQIRRETSTSFPYVWAVTPSGGIYTRKFCSCHWEKLTAACEEANRHALHVFQTNPQSLPIWKYLNEK